MQTYVAREGHRQPAPAEKHSFQTNQRRATSSAATAVRVVAQMGETLNQSPGVRVQMQLQRMLNQSPAVVAQRRLAETLSGRQVIQLQLHGSFHPASYAGANALGLNPISVAFAAWGMPWAPSQNLRLGLRLAGVPDSNLDPAATNNQAHHIVEANDPAALAARILLARAQIHIDSAVNGVFLPVRHADDTGNATVHLGPHVHDYANVVNTHVIQSINNDPLLYDAGLSAANLIFNNPPLTGPQFTRLRQVITGALNWLRNFLLNNPVQINKGYNVDEDFDPESKDQDRRDKRGGSGGGKTIERSYQQSFSGTSL
jgi:hypothetical protein